MRKLVQQRRLRNDALDAQHSSLRKRSVNPSHVNSLFHMTPHIILKPTPRELDRFIEIASSGILSKISMKCFKNSSEETFSSIIGEPRSYPFLYRTILEYQPRTQNGVFSSHFELQRLGRCPSVLHEGETLQGSQRIRVQPKEQFRRGSLRNGAIQVDATDHRW
ncbi:hypothetical protein L596_000681 [Steinernema carpocapsae]|uniref:Uncharacterized protein n=1 Tax=Steinernema carpocapsae TaxID=34508 RepID=A0A4U8UL94_STECR|nr:hypothetical protein L596_000681 [Steinernema carpocapsae]